MKCPECNPNPSLPERSLEERIKEEARKNSTDMHGKRYDEWRAMDASFGNGAKWVLQQRAAELRLANGITEQLQRANKASDEIKDKQYLSAVNGRKDFREALVKERERVVELEIALGKRETMWDAELEKYKTLNRTLASGHTVMSEVNAAITTRLEASQAKCEALQKELEKYNEGSASTIRGQRAEIEALEARVGKLTELLKEVKTHCLCSRFEPVGFDYGETHAKLGKPKIGSRWLTPVDLIDTRMNLFKGEALAGGGPKNGQS